MITAATETRSLIEEYFQALSSQPKTTAMIDRYVKSTDLKQHILQAEAAFPGYQLITHQMLVEGDSAAVRATMKGTHKGTFAGIEPTGKQVTAEVMMFYRVDGGFIVEFHMQLDMMSLLGQLQAN